MTKSITFSTHVLDTSTGQPASGVPIALTPAGEGAQLSGRTDADGRLRFPDPVAPGEYELTFELAGHFGAQPHLSDRLRLHVRLEEPRHYHVPLLVSPFGVASYRGS